MHHHITISSCYIVQTVPGWNNLGYYCIVTPSIVITINTHFVPQNYIVVSSSSKLYSFKKSAKTAKKYHY